MVPGNQEDAGRRCSQGGETAVLQPARKAHERGRKVDLVEDVCSLRCALRAVAIFSGRWRLLNVLSRR